MLTLQKLNESILYKNVGHLTRLLSRCLSFLADQKPRVAWQTFQRIFQGIESMTLKVEKDWKGTLLAALSSDTDLGSST